MAIPKLALIPSGVKAGKLYSVLPTNGDGDFTTTRNTVATRVNENGLIEEVASNVPRLDYSDGTCPSLLLEPASTNLIVHSELFSDASWTKIGSSVTSGFTSPDGTTSAFKLVEDSANSEHITFASPSVTLGDNTFSVFAKAGERNVLGIELPANGFLVSFNLSTGTFVNSQNNPDGFSITPFANGWYRIDITQNLSSSSVVSLSLREDNGNRVYQGDGTSGAYIWGAQLEANSYKTSYIKTVGTTQSRSADTANGAGDASTFNDSEGVLMVEIAYLKDKGISSPFKVERISISDSTDTNRLFISNTAIENQIQVFVRNAVGVSFNKTVTISDNTLYNKIVLKYKSNDFALWINGFELETDNTYSYVPSGLSVLKFQGASGAYDFEGNTKQIQYYDSALNDSDLEKLTSWTSFTAMANAQSYTII